MIYRDYKIEITGRRDIRAWRWTATAPDGTTHTERAKAEWAAQKSAREYVDREWSLVTRAAEIPESTAIPEVEAPAAEPPVCSYRGCDRPATHTADGVPYCGMDATYLAHRAVIVRIAPKPVPATGAPAARATAVDRMMHGLTGLDSPARLRGECHFCGQPVGPQGCPECA